MYKANHIGTPKFAHTKNWTQLGNMRKLLEKEFACVVVIEDKKLVVVKWNQKADEHKIREVYYVMIKAFKIYFVDKLIHEFTNAGIEGEYMDWLGNSVFRMIIRCGLRQLVVVDEAIHVKTQIENHIGSYPEKLKNRITVKYYRNINKALYSTDLNGELIQALPHNVH